MHFSACVYVQRLDMSARNFNFNKREIEVPLNVQSNKRVKNKGNKLWRRRVKNNGRVPLLGDEMLQNTEEDEKITKDKNKIFAAQEKHFDVIITEPEVQKNSKQDKVLVFPQSNEGNRRNAICDVLEKQCVERVYTKETNLSERRDCLRIEHALREFFLL